jgi:CubicO group peptidase (beta-lactamase class C family)
VDPATRFESASLSKPVFASFVLELVDVGELDLDAPLWPPPERFGAADDPRLRSLTARHVLLHRSGFPNWRADGGALRLQADPGTVTGYSGEGFEYLLAHLRGRRPVVDAELEDALRRHGLPQATWRPRGGETDVAWAHPASGTPHPPAPHELVRASGSLVASAFEVAAFVRMGLSSDALRDRWLAPGPDDPRRSLAWGRSLGPRPLHWQHGDSPGVKHLVAFDADRGDGVVVFTNGDGGRQLAREVCIDVLGECPWDPV